LTGILDAARESRNSPAVLKLKLSAIRSRNSSTWVFVYEGVDDVPIYETWIRRLSFGLSYEPMPSTGKSQVLGFRDMMLKDQTKLCSNLLFFIDRDFDELRGRAPHPNTFLTDMYSVENYLVSKQVVESILIDEFRLAGDDAERKKILEIFDGAFLSFLDETRVLNQRLFRLRQLGADAIVEENVSRFVDIGLTSTIKRSDASPEDIIKAKCSFIDARCAEIDRQFEVLEPAARFRGKYLLGFMKKWLSALADDRVSARPIAFTNSEPSFRADTAATNLRSLASRSATPKELKGFLEQCGSGS